MSRYKVTKDTQIQRMIDELDNFSRDLPRNLKRNLDGVMRPFTESLRSTMPVESGRLKASGHWSSELDESEYEASSEFGGETAPYAPYVIGRYVNGNHAWDDVLPAYEEAFEAAIVKALNES